MPLATGKNRHVSVRAKPDFGRVFYTGNPLGDAVVARCDVFVFKMRDVSRHKSMDARKPTCAMAICSGIKPGRDCCSDRARAAFT